MSRQTSTNQENSIAQEIADIRRVEGSAARQLRTFEVNAAVADVAIRELRNRGRLYNDGREAYYFDSQSHTLTQVRADSQALRRLLASWGILRTDRLFDHTTEAIWIAAMDTGEAVTVHRFSHYAEKANSLYVHDSDSRVWRVRAHEVGVVENGTDGVLFVSQSPPAPWPELPESPEWTSVTEALVGDLRFDTTDLSASDQSRLVVLWYYSLFFPELFPTKPILAVIGPRGSGKSSLLRRMGRYLFGPGFNVTPLPNEDGLVVLLTNRRLVALDNADRTPRWLDDRLATAATGGTFSNRLLYRNNEIGDYPIVASVAITSRTPDFRREDVASRLLPIKLQALDGEYIAEAEMLADATRRRPAVLATTMATLAGILGGKASASAPQRRQALRMADFAAFAERVGYAFGGDDGASDCRELVERLARAQAAFGEQDDHVIDLIDRWVRLPDNAGRQVLPGTLLAELQRLAAQTGGQFDCNSAQALGHLLDDRRASLEQRYGMTRIDGAGRSRYYVFALPPEGVARASSENSETTSDPSLCQS